MGRREATGMVIGGSSCMCCLIAGCIGMRVARGVRLWPQRLDAAHAYMVWLAFGAA
jgi:hypothetical protein